MKRTPILLLCMGVLAAGCSSGSTTNPSFGDVDSVGPGEDQRSEGDLLPDNDQTGKDLAGEDETTPDGSADANGSPCDDSNPCTFGETLDSEGQCTGGKVYSCDDGRPCTTDTCDGQGDCLFALQADWCLVDGLCLQDGAPNPENGCLVCSLETPTQWKQVGESEPCDDSDACTQGEVCQQGVCAGGASIADSCADDNPCTQDQCEPANGCVHINLNGTACPPPDACTSLAVCVEGVCTPDPAASCDDGNPCTADSCGDAGCEHVALDGLPCDDGDSCTQGDLCVGTLCVAGDDTPKCDDGNLCTEDLCHPDLGCYHQLADNPCCNPDGTNVCDDGNFCTYDDCNPDTGECFYTFHSLPCSDFNVCTGPDVCSEGLCVGAPLTCDDMNPCTVDSCQVPGGCLHEPLDGVPCDDGLDCSTGDACVQGACVADMSACACQPQFSDVVNKVTSLTLGTDGNPPNGLDIDANPATCAPTNKCSQGVDNALSAFAGLVGSALQDAVDNGDIVLLMEHRDYNVTGDPYTLSVYIGQVVDPACDATTTTCSFTVSPDSFNEQCQPLVQLDNATISGLTLRAGGPGYNFPFQFPISETAILEVTLYSAQIQGTLTFSAGLPSVVNGVLGGAINKQQMLTAVQNLPPEVELPLDKAMIIQMLNSMVKVDIDTDGDGLLDAASAGMPFVAYDALISGMATP